jgi:hypothetical protein
MGDFVFEIDLVATVRVRATTEDVAREVVPIVKAPTADEIRLANENNIVIGPGRDATVTDVDFSIRSIKLLSRPIANARRAAND